MNNQDRERIRRVIEILEQGEVLDDAAREHWSYARQAINEAVPKLLDLIGDPNPYRTT